MKYIKLFFIILICLIIVIYSIYNSVILKYNRQLINFYSRIFKNKNKKENIYFINNFETLCSKYYYPNITSKESKIINCSRKAKNEYTLLNKNIFSDIISKIELYNKNSEKTILDIVKRAVKYVHFNNKPIKFEDCFVIDCLHSNSINFPFFHTDVEWNAFCDSHGFQVWILLKEEKKKNRGNMFIMETPYVTPGKTLKIEYKKIKILENGVDDNIISVFNDLKELKPKIRYLDAKVGEIFIMNSNVFHTSDPRELQTKRIALSFRVIYKPDVFIKICINNSYYSHLLLVRLELSRFYELLLKKKNIIFKKDNNYLTKKLFY